MMVAIGRVAMERNGVIWPSMIPSSLTKQDTPNNVYISFFINISCVTRNKNQLQTPDSNGVMLDDAQGGSTFLCSDPTKTSMFRRLPLYHSIHIKTFYLFQ